MWSCIAKQSNCETACGWDLNRLFALGAILCQNLNGQVSFFHEVHQQCCGACEDLWSTTSLTCTTFNNLSVLYDNLWMKVSANWCRHLHDQVVRQEIKSRNFKFDLLFVHIKEQVIPVAFIIMGPVVNLFKGKLLLVFPTCLAKKSRDFGWQINCLNSY